MALTLPGKHYTDPALYALEMERLYWNAWIWAGREEDIEHPGSYFLRDVAGESIIVTRDPSGFVRAFYNVCRHRGTRMCTSETGTFPGRIQCPYHGWSYGLDGRLLGAPHMEIALADYPLHRVHTAVWDGHIFLHLGREAPPFDSQLGALRKQFRPWRMADLRRYKRIVYEVNANWKLIVLNYNECLHCPLLHPALNRLTDYLGADNEPPSDHYVGGCMGFKPGFETMSLDGLRRRDYLPGLSEEQRKLVAYYAIYPNLLLSLHPDYMMVHSIWPRAVNKTEIVCEWLFHASEMAKADFQGDDAVEFWDLTNREDWRISEQSQAGIASRAYTPGPYSAREALLHAFDQYILRSLE
jgi:Rieske 2Fe-2S family protein